MTRHDLPRCPLEREKIIATLVPPIGAAELEAALHALRITRMLRGASGNMTVSVEGGNIVVREAQA